MDPISLLFWLVGLVLTVILVVAVCQLFAIRRSLDTLVRLQSPESEPSGQPVPMRTPEQARVEHRRATLIFAAFAVVLFFGVMIAVLHH